MLIVIDAHNLEGRRTGVGRYLINLLKEWTKFDLPKDLKFILYFKKEIPVDLSSCDDDRFEKKILKAPFGYESNAFFVHYLLPQAAKRDKADILFCPGYVAPLFYRGKIALALHDIIYEARPELYNWPSAVDKILLKKVSKISAKKAKVIFTCSEFSRQEILKYYQVRPEKVLAIPLAADECFNPDVGGSTSKFILYVGSIFNRRHLSEAILAFEKIAGQLPDEQFLIIGANHTSPFTPHLSRIKKFLRKALHFLSVEIFYAKHSPQKARGKAQSSKGAGFIDIDGLIKSANQKLKRPAILRKDYSSDNDLISLYRDADLLVWLSDYEGFGLPILEAMACGTPVITTPAASIPEVAGQAAIYVKDPKNIDEIAQVIYNVLTSENLRQDLIKRGLEQAKKFSWKKCARKTLNALLS